MDAATRRKVRERSGGRCEYCRLSQAHEPAQTFHVEHVTARQHGGTDALDNLALACQLCNSSKGPNLTGLDPDTGAITPLFHPRRDHWEDHFRMETANIRGLTATGRTTVWLLDMNCEERLLLRQVLMELGEWN
jgi:5-methylcytosine-specific restriction endonuclease McrA